MTRLSAMEKGEYYPTPLSVVSLIGSRISVVRHGRQVVRILDPCCGCGRAAARLAEILQASYPDLRVETWGVEINGKRAEEAATRLTRVVHAPFEAVSWKPDQIASILFLNPPYDFSADEYAARRLETKFLEMSIKALEPGGLLIFIVSPAGAKSSYFTLFGWCDDLQVFRFRNEDGFDEFHQVVIFGRRKPAPEHYSVDWEKARESLLGKLKYGEIQPEGLPDLNHLNRLQCVATVQRGKIFRARWTEEEIREYLEKEKIGIIGPFLQEMYRPEDVLAISPLLPLKRGHLASVIAAGLIGTLHFPGEVIKGRAVKVQELIEEVTDDDEEVTEQTFRDRYENHIVRVTPTGVQHLSSPSEVKEFLEQHAERLARLLEQRLIPYGNNATPEENAVLDRLSPNRLLPGMEKPGLFPAQRESAIALARSVRKHGIGHLVAEMGFGKTTVALATAELLHAYPVAVICPPHLVDKWARETVEVIPGARAVVVENLRELQDVISSQCEGERLVVIISRSWAKLGSGWEPAVVYRHVLVNKDGKRQWKKMPTCPVCGGVVINPPYTSEEDLARRPHFCCNRVVRFRDGDFVEEQCGAPLFQVGTKLRRYPLAEYIAKKAPGFFRLLVVDEVHQYKSKDSDQGWSFQLLAKTIPWKITLTGTFFGGPASSIFWLLHRSQANVRAEFGFSDEQRWIDRYGIRETRIVQKREDYGVSYYRGRKKARVTARERPGISPAVIRYLLPTVVFKTLADLGIALPPFRDEIVRLEMTPEQKADYQLVYDECWEALRKFWPHFTSSWLQWTLSRSNSCFRAETITFPNGERLVIPPVIHDYHKDLLPKEIWLLGCVTKELQEGRQTVIYIRQTGTRDIRQRVVDVLRIHAGIDATILSESVDPRKREAWLKSRSPRVLVVNPRLVETGLDLVDYSTIIWFEPDYSLYTLWQACRRVWRLGQTRDVRVFYLTYADTMEELALDLIGQKLAYAQLLYGEDVSGALTPDMDDNLVVQLIRSIETGKCPDKVVRLFTTETEAKAEVVLVSSDSRTPAIGTDTEVVLVPSNLSADWSEWAAFTPRRKRNVSHQPTLFAWAAGYV